MATLEEGRQMDFRELELLVQELTLNGTNVTATATELNLMDGVTATTAELNVTDGINATTAEINKVADESTKLQIRTTSGTVGGSTVTLELDHDSVIIAATIAAVIGVHDGFFMVKDTSDSGTAAHTVTLTGGTWDGSATIITLNAAGEAILVYFDSEGDGTIIENVGGVALS